MFPTAYQDILALIEAIDPLRYAQTRNFVDGCVTKLSPYLSRGVISSKQVFDHLWARGASLQSCQKLVQELAWREYFQRVHQAKGDLIFKDLKQAQTPVRHTQLPKAIYEAETGIEGVDAQIKTLYETGYMHNHARMYVASMACNLAGAAWPLPARWLYYHLLDADVASNTCSWQWVAGTFSQKKYFANQETINKYSNTTQKGTFLDVDYAAFSDFACPDPLKAVTSPPLTTQLPPASPVSLDANKPILLYNFYNLDPCWRAREDVNRVLILEPSHFQRFPSAAKSLDFMLALGKNIPHLQLYVGEWSDLKAQFPHTSFFFKEHPLFSHYEGFCDPREWMFPQVTAYFPSFFAFWKQSQTHLPQAWIKPLKNRHLHQ